MTKIIHLENCGENRSRFRYTYSSFISVTYLNIRLKYFKKLIDFFLVQLDNLLSISYGGY